MESIKNYFKYTFDFVGVCGRKEFWIPFLLSSLLQVLVWGLSLFFVPFQIVALVLSFVLIIPTTSLTVRRLHDTDRGAIYLLWLLLPIAGLVILLVFLAEKTKYFPK